MNNKLLKILTVIALCVPAYLPPAVKAQTAVSLLFTPTTATIVQNETVALTININVDTNIVQTSDVILLYAANDLEFISAANGNFFPSYNFANDPANGRLELHGYTSSSDSKTGSGMYAVVVFKIKKSSGSSTVSFDCSDTHINSTVPQDILSSCASQTNSVALTYSSGAALTPTATVTIAPQSGTGISPTAHPTSAPNTIPTCNILSSDISRTVGPPVTVTFTCSGTDPDGYINAAEFTFGDYTHDTIYKNAGSPGSISTTHTYTTIGTLGVSCRVRDNNNVFSGIPNECTQIVYINPKPTRIASSYYERVIAAQTTYTDPVITSQPVPDESPAGTSETVAIVYETPIPKYPEIITVLPEEQVSPDKTSIKTFWWIPVILIIILTVLFILLRRRKKKPPHIYIQPPPTPPIP